MQGGNPGAIGPHQGHFLLIAAVGNVIMEGQLFCCPPHSRSAQRIPTADFRECPIMAARAGLISTTVPSLFRTTGPAIREKNKGPIQQMAQEPLLFPQGMAELTEFGYIQQKPPPGDAAVRIPDGNGLS